VPKASSTFAYALTSASTCDDGNSSAPLMNCSAILVDLLGRLARGIEPGEGIICLHRESYPSRARRARIRGN
jgi:hypothetical protein